MREYEFDTPLSRRKRRPAREVVRGLQEGQQLATRPGTMASDAAAALLGFGSSSQPLDDDDDGEDTPATAVPGIGDTSIVRRAAPGLTRALPRRCRSHAGSRVSAPPDARGLWAPAPLVA